MKRIFVAALLGLSAMACGNDCDDAADKLEECGFPTGDGESSDEADECSGDAECLAGCINDASCDDIKAFLGEGEDNAFAKCSTACVGG